MSKLLNKTQFLRPAGLISAVAFAALFFSCKINTPPLVEIDQGDKVSVTNGGTAEFTTTITDPDEGQEITYQWYIDGKAVDGATSSDFGYVTGPVDNPVKYTVRVVATDEKGGSGEDSAELTVNPAEYYPLDLTGSFEYSIDLGSNPRDVYFLFTNITESNQSTLPAVNQTFGSRSLGAAPAVSRPSAPLSTGPIAQRGAPEISKLNNGPLDLGSPISSRDLEPVPRSLDTVGQVAEFTLFNRTGYSTQNATCKRVVSANGKTLSIWVAEDSLSDYPDEDPENKLEVLADKFLTAGDNNDIYDWISGIFGDEWGPHEAPGYLIPSDDRITIILYDIDSDEVPPPHSNESRIVGLFDSTHNRTYSFDEDSNERIMFSLDAALYADDNEGGTWEITDYWPQEVISTLAHEFQHMIHYYQKNVLLDGAPDTWLNEMCSLMAEDFVADKLGVRGPRGVDPSDGSAGPSPPPYINFGRLPLFNYYNDFSLIDWDYSDPLPDYSLAYSFGAFLGRNFGGTELFRHIVQNSEGDYKAVEYALSEIGYAFTFWDVLRRWAVAVVYSDSISALEDVQFNQGNWFTSTAGGITYKLGSANLYNYEYYDEVYDYTQQGPFFYTVSPVGERGTHYKTATSYYLAGTGLTGENSWNVDLPPGVRLTVVLK